MRNLQWLLQGDPVVFRLTRKYLLDETVPYLDEGFIGQYLTQYDKATMKWGNGFYGPKWISTNYTLLDLKYMEIDPKNPAYQDSILNYLDHFFKGFVDKFGIDEMDLCMTGMFINLLSYGKIVDKRMEALIDYALKRTMPDGAWNCMWKHTSHPKISSVHTTMNVLEGLAEYVRNGYRYRIDEVKATIERAVQTLLSRQLIFKKGTKEPIIPHFAQHHFPFRWKYDYLRVLEFLARIGYPYHKDMQPALDILNGHLRNGRLTKGTKISGLIHFPLEHERYGRFNTLRAYIVLKQYDPARLRDILNQTIK